MINFSSCVSNSSVVLKFFPFPLSQIHKHSGFQKLFPIPHSVRAVFPGSLFSPVRLTLTLAAGSLELESMFYRSYVFLFLGSLPCFSECILRKMMFYSVLERRSEVTALL